MKTTEFSYDLPEGLIAMEPTEFRSDSRLMHLDIGSGQINHLRFNDLTTLLNSSDLLVFNNTRVIPARILGSKKTGGRVELMLNQIQSKHRANALVGSNKSVHVGSKIQLGKDFEVLVEGRDDNLFDLLFPEPGVLAIASELGEVPLPPYLKKTPSELDQVRYQTIYAKVDGAVAAPTAGLHFDDNILKEIDKKGISREEITLHVGAGTFLPVRRDDILDHKMHKEALQVNPGVCDAVNLCRNLGGRVVAVGTTSVRSLEAASVKGILQPMNGSTDLFIHPGYDFQVVDAMITNFHLPKSTLMMLVSAFAGLETIRKAYRVAIEESYRFFSYGDAMFITR